MKKIRVSVFVLSLFLLLSGVLPVSAANMKEPVGNVTVYKGKPTIDGVVTDDEYKASKKTVINHINMKALPDVFPTSAVPESLTITFYQLWDETGLYLAAVVADSTPARGETGEGGKAWKFNGDNIQIFLDPGPTLAGKTLLDTDQRGGRRAPLYAIGVNQDDTYFWLRQLVKNEMIVNLSENAPASAAKKTETGWCFELCIPWTMLVTDINEKISEGQISEKMFKDGAMITAMLIYNDFFESDGTNIGVGMYQTSLQTEIAPFDWQPEVFGITLNLSEKDPASAESVALSSDTSSSESSSSKVNMQTVKASSSPAQDDGKTPVQLMIIIVSVVILATGATVFILIRKRQTANPSE